MLMPERYRARFSDRAQCSGRKPTAAVLEQRTCKERVVDLEPSASDIARNATHQLQPTSPPTRHEAARKCGRSCRLVGNC
jgi:hypothetical protein